MEIVKACLCFFIIFLSLFTVFVSVSAFCEFAENNIVYLERKLDTGINWGLWDIFLSLPIALLHMHFSTLYLRSLRNKFEKKSGKT